MNEDGQKEYSSKLKIEIKLLSTPRYYDYLERR
jgi:hypothetical protein